MDVVQSTYFALAKKWHPDRLPEELSEAREAAAKVFSRLTEAFQTLTDPERRKRYLELTKDGGATPEEQEKVSKILEAQTEFQKAEILFKKGDLAGAEKFAARAASKDPEQVDYSALLAWLRAAHVQAPDELAGLVEEFDVLLAREPNHQRSLWYRGQLLKRLGNEARAVKDFRKLIELDPKHIDATREIRLHEMRHPGGSAKAGSLKDGGRNVTRPDGGLLGKLFKK